MEALARQEKHDLDRRRKPEVGRQTATGISANSAAGLCNSDCLLQLLRLPIWQRLNHDQFNLLLIPP
jgi:hypothetical protein